MSDLAKAFVGVLGVVLIQCGGPATNGNLTVPEGFEIELAAGAPLVERPMIIDIDEQGRMYVAESSGSTDSVAQQLIDRPHSILRLEDVDGDGEFDRRTVFADKMMLPEGVLWHDGSVYVAAPPVIWKLTDTDDDGVADQREKWFDGKTLNGCANDLHGPYLGPDGWIYWAKGAFEEQTYERPGRPPLVTSASHIFRRRPEGGPIEPVLTGGMDNPLEVAFSSEGERFLTSTFTEHPTRGRRDGLLHALYGGVYGKVHRVTDSHPMTGGFNKVMTQMDATVPVGLARYESTVLGDAFRDNLFVTLFNMRKVTRHRLIPEGATYRTEESDFLVSDSYDFHPTDVMEDADGSLLIVDTGAWYKICCPTSQLAKPEVLGAIYRVRRTGAAPVENPRGEDISWADLAARELTSLLGDRRPAVRKRAIAQLAKAGVESIEALVNAHGTVELRRNAVWALTRIADDRARSAVRKALADPDESVRHAALHSVSVRRDREATELVLAQLRSGSSALKRVAAEALGRIGDRSDVPELLAATALTDDRALVHSLIYALIEIAAPDATRAGLSSASAQARRAALIALDQMEPQNLKPDAIVPLLSSADPLISQTAEWIAGKHPEWGGELAGYFRRRIGDPSVAQQIHKFSTDATIQQMLAETVNGPGAEKNRITVLGVMANAAVDEMPQGWTQALTRALEADQPGVVEAAVHAARRLPLPEDGDPSVDAALIHVAQDQNATARVRAGAAEVSIERALAVNEDAFEFLLNHLGPSQPVDVRGAASRALAKAPLSEQQLQRVAESIGQVGPMELPSIVESFGRGSSEELGNKLLQALEASGGFANLRADILETVAEGYPPEFRLRARALLADQEVDADEQRQRIEKLLASFNEGDIRRGQAVFNSTEAACASCHTIGYQGGDIGPALSRIGRVRTEQDLLESIVFPSLSFVRSYEPIVVVTTDDVHSGVTLEESETHLVLATGADEQVRIAKADVEEIRPGTVSVMPAGLAEEFSGQELIDLVAFLKDTAYKPWQRP